MKNTEFYLESAFANGLFAGMDGNTVIDINIKSALELLENNLTYTAQTGDGVDCAIACAISDCKLSNQKPTHDELAKNISYIIGELTKFKTNLLAD